MEVWERWVVKALKGLSKDVGNKDVNKYLEKAKQENI